MASDVWSARHRSTFRDLKHAGTVVRVSPLSAVVLHDAADQPVRLAFAVPTAVGTAVTRNRLRRQVRARIGLHAQALRGHVVLVRISPRAAQLAPRVLLACTDRLVGALTALPSAVPAAAGSAAAGSAAAERTPQLAHE